MAEWTCPNCEYEWENETGRVNTKYCLKDKCEMCWGGYV